MEEPLKLTPFKKYIYLAGALLLALIIAIIVNDSLDAQNQAAWTSFNAAKDSVTLETAFKEHKNSEAAPWIGFALANSLFAEGKMKKAGQTFKEVAEMDISYLTPYAMQGCVDVFNSLGKKDEAQKYIDRINRDFKHSVPAQLLKKG